MARFQFLQILLLIAIIPTAQTLFLQCGIGEVLQPYNMTCTRKESGEIMFREAGESSLIAQCGSTNAVNRYPDKYAITLINYSDKRECILTILNVTAQSQGLFTCFSGFASGNSSCDFKVYARPESVSCQEPQVQNDKVHVVCAVRKVYPDFKCQFTVITNDSVYQTQETFPYSSTEGASGFYDGNCSLELALQNLGLGSHKFKVTAYPDVTEQATDMKYGRNSSSTDSLIIRFPSAELKPSQDGYVLEGSAISFTCRDINSFVLANVTIKNEAQMLNMGYGYTTYSVTAHRGMRDITCQSRLLNMTSAPVTVKLQVAYGPNQVSLKVMHDIKEITGISLCGKTRSVTLTINCSIAGDVSPGATLKLNLNGTEIPSPSGAGVLSYDLTRSGPLLIRCIGSNTNFPQQSANQIYTVLVSEPPTQAPVIDIAQEGSGSDITPHQLTVPEGSKIQCRAEGGYPPVSHLTLGCGTHTNQVPGNVAVFDVNVTRNMDTSQCFCNATHNSSCDWDSATSTHLDVLFKPTVISFQANGDPSGVTIRNNSLMEFSCQAEGNPSPRLSISKDQVEKWTYSNSAQKFGLKFITNTTVDCRDTGIYYCRAQQNQYVVGITVAVYVKCAQQLGHSASQDTVYAAQLNGTLSITVPVYGYPEPTALHLDGKKYALANEEYQLEYTKLEPPFGDVSLEIYTARKEVFQNYSLFINSTEGFLVYNFEIVVEEVPPAGPGLNVAALVGGIVGGVLVIVIAVLIFTILKRKGIVGNSKGHGEASTQLSNLSDGDQAGTGFTALGVSSITVLLSTLTAIEEYVVVKTGELGYLNTQLNHLSDTDETVPMPHTAGKPKGKVSDHQKDSSTFEYENWIPNVYDEIPVYQNT